MYPINHSQNVYQSGSYQLQMPSNGKSARASASTCSTVEFRKSRATIARHRQRISSPCGGH